MDLFERSVLYFIHCINGVGNSTLWTIKKSFGSFTKFYESNSKLMYSSSIPNQIINEIINTRKNVDPLKNLENLFSEDIKIVCVVEDEYPESLQNIYNKPYMLYYRGDLKVLNQTAFAIVGARTATPYGRKVARQFGRDLSAQNISIVSGMARGIDAEAHWGALESGGKTVAILGSGIKIIYPKENVKLYEEITKKGVVLSEFVPTAQPKPGNFPQRNRIISGLSKGLLVVEAKEKSGALITVDFALEQGKDVFAVPGPITSNNSKGTNQLIKDGAKIVTQVDDVLEEYKDVSIVMNSPSFFQEKLKLLDNNENKIIQYIGYNPIHLDEVIKNVGLNIGEVSTIILKLELDGIIQALPGNYYVKV
ncbi:hypothetical protein SYNTR_0559 [Candidatus Syntrophocurvum alkaliphilum]|uniref:Uncharacterized protein n=1 Tax=Candidatus Syntrophocurvum alkaliphilum TaxID=2293317 RepID=A0A6I6DEN4_9FIRM|nr:DNA-processing protein DprA [Candidatus Syntrophocurvum alkaliphilum]QGT99152.1 hypothetical protein SYNTR_0559 [Candidatus Syntrophocurvum alkaliphilum]